MRTLRTTTEVRRSNYGRTTYSDIVTELEKAHKLSSEVTIYDVIKECEGLKTRAEVIDTLSKYEIKFKNKEYWNELMNNMNVLSNPISFIGKGHQLRLKEGE